jgi:hypothetical protein
MRYLDFCIGINIDRCYFIPSIELERLSDGQHYLTIVFLKWYIGLRWD